MSGGVRTATAAELARRQAGAGRRMRPPALLAALLVAAGCFGERERPGGITDPDGSAALSATVIAPAGGSVVIAGESIPVWIDARDQNMLYLEGVGFVVRRIGAGGGIIDSVGIRFPVRSDTTHQFTLQVPDVPTNTQLDIYGIAYGHGGGARLSAPVHVTVARLSAGVAAAHVTLSRLSVGVAPGMAWSLH